jgi:hypothetical protein
LTVAYYSSAFAFFFNLKNKKMQMLNHSICVAKFKILKFSSQI